MKSTITEFPKRLWWCCFLINWYKSKPYKPKFLHKIHGSTQKYWLFSISRVRNVVLLILYTVKSLNIPINHDLGLLKWCIVGPKTIYIYEAKAWKIDASKWENFQGFHCKLVEWAASNRNNWLQTPLWVNLRFQERFILCIMRWCLLVEPW